LTAVGIKKKEEKIDDKSEQCILSFDYFEMDIFQLCINYRETPRCCNVPVIRTQIRLYLVNVAKTLRFSINFDGIAPTRDRVRLM